MPQHNSRTTVIEPAPLSVRFSAGILDVGLVIFCVAAVSLFWRLIHGVPVGEVGYVPPTHADALGRLLKSLGFYCVVGVFYAAWISSRLKATPGMLMINAHVHSGRGDKIGFFRALFWYWTAFLPLYLCNVIVLLGVHFQTPLLHIGQLNVLSCLVLLQVIWFLMMLSGQEKRAVHDMIWNVHVDHTTRPFSHPVLKHIAFLPLSGVAVVALSLTMVVAIVNLLDAPLHSNIKQYQNIIPDDTRDLVRSWRNDAPFKIAVDNVDFSCAAHKQRFVRRARCPSSRELQSIIETHREKITRYWQDFDADADLRLLTARYTFQESIQLTDLVLADFLLRFRDAPARERRSMFDRWLILAHNWDDIFRAPSFLHLKTAVSLQYNHVLRVLPMMLDMQPDLLGRQSDRIDDLLRPIAFDSNFLRDLLAFQFAHYNWNLERARIDYFPFIQPNYMRNQFLKRANDLQFDMIKFSGDEYDPADDPEIVAGSRQFFDPKPTDNPALDILKTIYNPLGRAIYENISSAGGVQPILLSSYTLNNSLKRVLTVILKIKRQDIVEEEIPEFIDSLPENLRHPLNQHELGYSPAGPYLYHYKKTLPDVRRIVPF